MVVAESCWGELAWAADMHFDSISTWTWSRIQTSEIAILGMIM